jgi:hypothetical protein
MISEFIRMQHSIDSIDSVRQVAPTFKWIRIFENRFKNVEGVQEKTQILLTQLRDIEL